MRTVLLTLAICGAIAGLLVVKNHRVTAATTVTPASAPTVVAHVAVPATTQAAGAAPVNKYCAVEGSPNKVDPTVFVIYKGQKIGFCCDDCIKDFNKNPDKYVASMK